MVLIRKIFTGIIFLAILQPVFSATVTTDLTIKITEKRESLSIGKRLNLYEDRSGKVNIEDVIKHPEKIPFNASTQDSPHFGITSSVFWAYADLKNSSEKRMELLAELNYALFDHVDFYIVSNKQVLNHQTGGDRTPFSIRQIKHRNPVFTVALEPGEKKRILFRLETEGSMIFPIKLWKPGKFLEKTIIEYASLGIYYGILGVMLLYNLFVFLSVRDIPYFYYIIFIAMHFFFQASMNGLGYQYLWPGGSAWSNTSGTFSTNMVLLAAFNFTRSFLNLKSTSKNLNRVMWIFMGMALFGAFLSLLTPYKISVRYGIGIGFFGTLAMFISGFMVYFSGYRPARFYIIAWSALLVGVGLFALRAFGIVPPNLLTTAGMQIGSTMEVILLSLALADRINSLKEEKDRAQRLAIENLHQADKMKDEFLANTSHELRTPLTGIIGIAESLIGGIAGELGARVKNNLALIVTSGRRLAVLINDLLDIAKLKNHDLKLHLKPISLYTLAEVVVETSRPLITGKHLTLENKIPRNIPAILADENRLQQILYNLIGNAIKFTYKGQVLVTAEEQDKFIKISITDSGVGIPHDKQEEIFRNFIQVSSEDSPDNYGTGLGLPITRQLVLLHGGNIWVTSEPGQGSTFFFTIPKSSQQWAATTTTELVYPQVDISEDLATTPVNEIKTRLSFKNPQNVLIVDDEPVNRVVLKNLLDLMNIKTSEAIDGREALEMMELSKPDLVLLDVMMPEINGFDVCRQIRKKYSIFELPVIMLTAKDRLNDLMMGFECGANDYLTKPYSRQELTSRVQTLLELKNSIEENARLQKVTFEIEAAVKLQNSHLPKKDPQFNRLDIVSQYFPSYPIGGDIFGYFEKKEILEVYLADVSGHGIAAAMFSGMVKLAASMIATENDNVIEILQKINRSFLGNFQSYFLTMAYLQLDTRKKVFHFGKAGHTPLIVYNRKERSVKIYTPPGRPLGIINEIIIEELTGDMKDGDRFILFTDGLLEPLQAEKEEWDIQPLTELIINNGNLPPKEFVQILTTRVINSPQYGEYNDDITLIAMDYNE